MKWIFKKIYYNFWPKWQLPASTILYVTVPMQKSRHKARILFMEDHNQVTEIQKGLHVDLNNYYHVHSGGKWEWLTKYHAPTCQYPTLRLRCFLRVCQVCYWYSFFLKVWHYQSVIEAFKTCRAYTYRYSIGHNTDCSS